MASKPVHARTASSLHADASHTRKLSTGCAVLDGPLGGGLDSHGITELRRGGRRQDAARAAARAAVAAAAEPRRAGRRRGAAPRRLAERGVVARALRELAGAFAAKHARLGATQEKLLENVFVLQIESVEHLWTTLGARVEELLMNKRVRLLVLDSVAGLSARATTRATASGRRRRRRRARRSSSSTRRASSCSPTGTTSPSSSSTR